MPRPKIALPISQFFSAVFPELQGIAEVLIVRDVTRDAGAQAEPLRKVYHTNGFIDTRFAEEMNEQFLDTLGKNNIEHISFDFGPSCLDAEFNPRMQDCFWPVNSSPTLDKEEIIDIALRRLNGIRKTFKGRVALENLDYHEGGAYEHVCEPEFISEALKKLACYLALDIGHLLVTCFNFRLDPKEYLSRLPLELVREVHLSHPEAGFDKHGAPTDYEYGILDYLLSCSSPDFIVVEYYEKPELIIKENRRLNDFLSRHN